MQSRYNSHYGSYSKNRYHNDLMREKTTPTAKQKKFLCRLFAMCNENGIDPGIGHKLKTRCDYSVAINTLIARLNEAGVEVQGNGKTFTKCVATGTDSRGRDFMEERMEEVNEEDA